MELAGLSTVAPRKNALLELANKFSKEEKPGNRLLDLAKLPTVVPRRNSLLDLANTFPEQNKTKNRLLDLIERPASTSKENMPGLPRKHLRELGEHQHLSEAKISAPIDLGRLVRNTREEKGLTQQQLSDLSGVGRRFLSELENGKQSIEFGMALNVATAIGIELFAKRR